LLKKAHLPAALVGLLNAGALIFHALNGFMFVIYSGSLQALTPFNAVFEVVVYAYGLALAIFYITQFWKVISKNT
jgi:hypothetical protein